MTNEEIIAAIEQLQRAVQRAESTMRQPAKYIAEALVESDIALNELRKRKWIKLTNDDYAKIKQNVDIHDWPYAVAIKLKELNT